MGKRQDTQPRTRRPASASEIATRTKRIAKNKSEKTAANAAAAAAARARLQAQLLGATAGASSSGSEPPEVMGEVDAIALSTENQQTGTLDTDQSDSVGDARQGVPSCALDEPWTTPSWAAQG